MYARVRRRDRAPFPLSGPKGTGVALLLAVIAIGTLALPRVLAGSIAARGPFSPATHPAAPSPVSASGPVAPEPAPSPLGPQLGSATPGSALDPRPGNRAPLVRRVEFSSERVSTLGNLRLKIEAFDPDGDPVIVRTRWQVGDRSLETPVPVLGRELFSRGDRVQAVVVAGDGSAESEPFATPEIVVSNADPTITTFPRGFDANGAFVYPLGAVDPDGDRVLEFRLVEGPEGMRIEPHEGTLTWRPRADQAGLHRVRIEVHDGRGGHSAQVFDLDVRPTRREPGSLADR